MATGTTWTKSVPDHDHEARFQAIRDAVNDALTDLDAYLAKSSAERLETAGRALHAKICRNIPAILDL